MRELLRGPGARPTPWRERTLGILMIAGSALAFIAAALPPAAERSEAGVLACAAVALVVGVLLVGAAQRRVSAPEWALGLAALLGTTLVAVSTWAGGFDATGTEDNEMLFFWVALYSFYFFRTWHALLQVTAIAVAYGLLLGANSGAEEAPTRFIIVIGTLLVAGLLVARLRMTMEGLIEGLERQARRDELTGALNRRGLDESAAEAFPAAPKAGSAIGFLLIDLDDFTMYNDLQGQQAGDALLRHVAGAIRSSVRSGDVVARLGGDEFGVLLGAIDPDEVEAVASDVLTGLRQSWAGTALTTVSIGASCGSAGEHSLADLWRSADRALEVARRTGGNQARFARDPLPSLAD
jgi:diguanylate cyclase (GGDEF)-like protein